MKGFLTEMATKWRIADQKLKKKEPHEREIILCFTHKCNAFKFDKINPHICSNR